MAKRQKLNKLIEQSTPSRCAFLMGAEKMELTEKEAHCVARLIQGGVFSKRAFDGCYFCKYQDECQKLDEYQISKPSFYKEIAAKITAETKVDIKEEEEYKVLPLSFVPIQKFLKNANNKMMNYFKRYVENC